MKNRIDLLFQNKTENILSVFLTAGFPSLNDTVDIIKELDRKGVDMVEIGIPFSDPLADGPVIQKSSTVALKNGISLKEIFQQVKEVRKEIDKMPFVLMGYINPIMQYGYEEFFRMCKETGIDSVIIPDLPFDVYMRDFKDLSRQYEIPLIMLITPETSEKRIIDIDKECDGFIYMVSSASTTGTKDRFTKEQIEYFERINHLPLHHKRLIGFGISNPLTLKEAWANSSGAIIGSLFIKCLESEKSIRDAVNKLFDTLGVNQN